MNEKTSDCINDILQAYNKHATDFTEEQFIQMMKAAAEILRCGTLKPIVKIDYSKSITFEDYTKEQPTKNGNR